MSIHQLVVPTFTQMLGALQGQLDKGAAFSAAKGDDPSAFMTARIAPDMFPLSSQVRFSCIQASECLDRLGGREPRKLAEVATMDDAKALISETVAAASATDAAELDGAADRRIEVSPQGGIVFEMSGMEFVRDWALPQFYFHTVTAYAILRHGGVEIGKRDFVPHMMAYLRAPQG